MALITYADFTAVHAAPSAFTQTIIEKIIDRVQAQVERWCGRVLEGATFTEKHDGDGSEILLVRNPPIRTLTSIAITDGNGTTTYTTSSSPALDDLFRWTGSTDERGEIRWIDAVHGRFVSDGFGAILVPQFGVSPHFPEGFQNITVVYDGGWATTPDDLVGVMADLVADCIQQLGPNRYGRDPDILSESLGQFSYSLSPVMERDKRLNAVLQRYRRSAL